MLKSLEKLLQNFIDFILPERNDFSVVKKLDEKTIESLPRAPVVENALPRTELRSGTGVDWIHPLFHYKDNRVRAIIWELKYKENTLPLETIGRLIFEEIVVLMSDIIIFDSDAQFLLIPIPISAQRRAERGYNQSEHIAKAIIANDASHILLYAPQWLGKIKETERQSHSQSKRERMENLVGCFEADPRVEGKYVILIDDVVTTGSTLLEARSALLSSGTKDISAFTIAH